MYKKLYYATITVGYVVGGLLGAQFSHGDFISWQSIAGGLAGANIAIVATHKWLVS